MFLAKRHDGGPGGLHFEEDIDMKRILSLGVFIVAGAAALSVGCKQRETSTTTTNTETTRETAVTPAETPAGGTGTTGTSGTSGMGTSSSLTPTPTNP
jgi:hypothetical protein